MKKNKNQKYYVLDMFPYISGEGLHVGHPKSYTATDIIARYKRLNGFEVLHPIGWDAFGLPTENRAIKSKIHPKELTEKYIQRFKDQIKSLNFSYDWDTELATCDPEYYKWTQWLFLQFYKAGLAYKKQAPVNWCESCKTVLANEQVVAGKCERCKNEVIQKNLSQWFFKITKYTEELLTGLDDLDWPENIKALQKNWIGKSYGAEISFSILHSPFSIDVFTTRPDTIGGATFMVLAPEHEIVKKLKLKVKNYGEVEEYIKKAKKKTELERVAATAKDKTGVELKGIKAINPLSGEELPIFVSDYVLSSYGTGAVMCVPAHDERDNLFAKKYHLPIKEVIAPYFYTDKGSDAVRKDKPTIKRKTAYAFLKNPKDNKYLCLNWEKFGWHSGIIGGVENGEDYIKAATREIKEETGYQNIRFVKYAGGEVHNHFFAGHKDVNRYATGKGMLFELVDDEKKEIEPEHTKNHKPVWIDEDKMSEWLNLANFNYMWEALESGNDCHTDYGIIINSGKLNGLSWPKDDKKIIEIIGGKSKTQYKLRDWLISRQRYWGAPIPIIYCRRCWEIKNQKSKIKIKEIIIDGKKYAEIPVSEKDLPVTLPDDVDFRPTGESPLVRSKSFHNVKCPKCASPAHRESDTMDTFVDSSWYFLRYTDPRNKTKIFDKEKVKHWLPVDLYIGGAEHAVLHLLYARFFTKALRDLKLLDFSEPFLKLRNQGLILAEDSRKMSKSYGNVINPDDIVKEYGADTLKMYEMFMGPLEDAAPWDTKGINGVKRFLEKVERATEKVKDVSGEKLNNELAKLIKSSTHDIEMLKFNTAISSMMIFVNKLQSQAEISKEIFEKFLIILFPFAPETASKLWTKIEKSDINKASWPKFAAIKKEKETTFVIQINGKVRASLKADIAAIEKDILSKASELPNIKKYTEDKTIKKTIFVKEKLLNIVV